MSSNVNDSTMKSTGKKEEEEDLYHSRRFQSLQSALDLTLKKARDDIDLKRAIELGYTADNAVYQKVLIGILDSAHSEIRKQMDRSFEDLEVEDKLLRFELAMLKERDDREAKEHALEKERQDAKKAIESVRQQQEIDPEALIRQRQYQTLLKQADAQEAEVDKRDAKAQALEIEIVERTKAVEKRIEALMGQIEGVSQAADLCASAGV